MSMTLTYSTTTITFSPRPGYAIPQHREREQNINPNGTLIINEIFDIDYYEIPLNNISTANYVYFYLWWSKMYKLTFTPDTSAPGTTITVRIINTENPLQKMFGMGWTNAKYEGTLLLEKVSALS